jgi:hypothetical protein
VSRAIAKNELSSAMVEGVKQAHGKYLLATGDEWLWQAPEYVITTSLLDSLVRLRRSTHDANLYVTLESSVTECLTAAGARGRGILPQNLRHNGRFDLVLWWKKGEPRAAVEVKNQVCTYSQIKQDVYRLASLLRRKHQIIGMSSFQFAALVFYTSLRTQTRDPYLMLSRRVQRLVGCVKDDAKGLLVEPKSEICRDSSKDAWAACCIVLSASSA